MLLQIEETGLVFAVQEVHQMLFFLDETRLGQLAFELAQDLLLR